MGKMLKIMLAQDTDTQTGCAAALRVNGFEVETVRKDGAQILRLFRQGSRPDVLIMDAFMQGTDAIGVLGGLAEYLDVDATLIRILYAALSVFSAGFPGIVLYIICAIVIPEAPFDVQQ